MIICTAGDIHGAIDRFYEDVLAFEASLGVRFEWVLHVGDFGVWPNPHRIDKATRKHDGAGDFPEWWSERRAAPRRTLFIKGNHEDFVWLDAQPNAEALPNLFYLRNGRTFELGGIVVGGVGGCHGPSSYGRRTRDLQGYARRHYTREDIDAQVDGVPCVGLNEVRMPGNLVAIEVPERGRGWTVLGEWPERGGPPRHG